VRGNALGRVLSLTRLVLLAISGCDLLRVR
jgi:hypothetical protein